MRRRAKVDGNAHELDEVFEASGVSILKMDGLGDDAPDRLMGHQGVDQLVEYKNPEGRNRVSDGQEKFIKTWSGRPVKVVRTRDEAIALILQMRRDKLTFNANGTLVESRGGGPLA